jgi:cysteine desulfurase
MAAIYLDYNASTPIDPSVRAAMEPYLASDYGNPSSSHWAGWPAREALERARAEVAALVAARPEEIVFTSGGSEANNLAIKGCFFRARPGAPHIVTSAVEHPAVLEPCRFLEQLGARVTRVPVDRAGRVDPDDVRRVLDRDTILITIMHANNEVGTLEPIREIGALARERGIRFHTDAAQSAGKVPVDAGALGVDLLSIAGHKLYAPKGVGALYVRAGVELEPLIHGAGHERGRRAGTESVLLAVALGAACRLARADPCGARLEALRERFSRALVERLGERLVVNGHATERLPNTLNVSFPGHVGREVLARLDGVAASTGSACHDGSERMSPVLAAMGIEPRVGLGAVRFSLGRGTRAEELDTVVDRLSAVVG